MILGMLARMPAPKVKQGPGFGPSQGIICTAVLVAGVALMTIEGCTHTLNLTSAILVPVISAIVILISCMVRGVSKPQGGKKVVAKYAVNPAPHTGAQTTSWREMKQRADLLTRRYRIAALIVPDCPICRATTGQSCTINAEDRFTLLDKAENIRVHNMRIQKAVMEGWAKADDVIAQFDGRLPEGLILS